MTRPSVLAVVVLAFSVAHGGGRAEATRRPDDLEETLHRVEFTMERGVALLSVTRTFRNLTGRQQRMEVSLKLPPRSAVTAFELDANGVKTPGVLVTPATARARLTQLEQRGPAPVATVAALTPEDCMHLTNHRLVVVPVLPRATFTIRYSMTVDTTTTDWFPPEVGRPGWSGFEYPTLERNDHAERGEAQVRFAKAQMVPRQPDVTVAEPYVVRKWSTAEQLEAAFGTHVLPDGRALTGLWMGVGANLVAVPQKVDVVALVDASRSVGEEGLRAEMRELGTYLGWLEDARVEVILFRRKAEALFGEFIPSAEAVQRLGALKEFHTGNGSNVEDATALALARLKGRPEPQVPARVVLWTDGRMRKDFAVGAAQRAWPPETVVHFVGRHKQRPTGSVAWVALDTGGGAWREFPGEDLIRPSVIRVLSITADDLALHHGGWVFPAGREAWMRVVTPTAPARMQVDATVWNRVLRRPLAPSEFISRHLPALTVAAREKAVDLTALGLREGVLAPGTSMLAAPADAGPNRSPVPSYRRSGWACGGGSLCTPEPEPAPPTDKPAPRDTARWLRELLEPQLRKCGAEHGYVSLELTGREVVEVLGTSVADHAMACWTEAIWALDLDARFKGDHVTVNLRFPQPPDDPPGTEMTDHVLVGKGSCCQE